MARKRKYKKRRYRRRSSFNPVLSRGIVAIVIAIFAILIAVSFFGRAGTIGIVLDEYVLSFLFGKIRYTVPFVLLTLSWFILKDLEYNYRATHLIGAILFFLATSGLIHIGFEEEVMWQQSLDGNGGGVFGMIASPVRTYLGYYGGIIVLIGLIIISVVLIFNTAIAHFVYVNKKLFAGLGVVGKFMVEAVRKLFVSDKFSNQSDYEEDEYEEYDEDEDSVIAKKARMFFKKNVSEEDEEVIEDEQGVESEVEDIEEVEVPERSFTTSESSGNGDLDAAYLSQTVIKPIPPIALLADKKGKPTSGDIKEIYRIIKSTFREFKIEVDVVDHRVGPTVTQYQIKPAQGVKLSRITALQNNLALNLAAHPIRMEAPIPGKSLVGIEIPNEKVAMVTLKELLVDRSFKERSHNLMLALGKDVAGKVWYADLPRLPHLLIAGATGSGKTVCVNTILLSLLYQNTAETLRMILVDPKRVELKAYNNIPHLLAPVVIDTKECVNALKWTIGEMERRFEVLSQSGSRNLDSYNKKHSRSRMPHIVFVIDELADLMATAASEVEAGIIRLAQMARAVGIHLILATQRPSVDVITGLMKANIPGRIAFSVASLIDSRTILDAPGAEKLLGRGDMLLQTAELSKPVRIQGAFVSEKELGRVIGNIRHNKVDDIYDPSILEKQSGKGGGGQGLGGEDYDPLFEEAKQTVISAGKASASFLQRKMKIGYARAARILDELESAGVIGPARGAKPREILVTAEQEVTQSSMDMGQEANVFDEEGGSDDDFEQEVDPDIEDDYEEEYDDSQDEFEQDEEEK